MKMMETCGSISVSEDYKYFLLQCFYCSNEVEIEKWNDFVMHLKSDHFNCDFETNIETLDSTDSCCTESEYEDIDELDQDEDDGMITDYLDNIIDVVDECGPEDNAEGYTEKQCQIEDHQVEAANDKICNEGGQNNNEEEEAHNKGTDYDSSDGSREEQLDYDESSGAYNYVPSNQFNPSFTRRCPRTLQLIELYKSQSCLWNPQDINYRNEKARSIAYDTLITDISNKLNVMVKENGLKNIIKKLHDLYLKITKMLETNPTKVTKTMMRHYNKCDFLRIAGDPEDGDDPPQGGTLKLTFTEINSFTTDFIKLYSEFPQLYDVDHQDYLNMVMRKDAYKTISLMYGKETDDDVYQAINYLRRWYHKIARQIRDPNVTGLKKAEVHYFEKSSFLPLGLQRHLLFCEICLKKFFSDHKLQTHMFKEHNIGELPYQCEFCERRFSNRADMNVHKQRAHVDKTHFCSFCEKSFATQADCKLHERTHTGEKPFICDQCGKAFRSAFQLRYHVSGVHLKAREFKCHLCPKRYLKNQQLTNHVKAHLNIRDKKCEICDKAFTNIHSLIRHRKIHTKEKKQRKKK